MSEHFIIIPDAVADAARAELFGNKKSKRHSESPSSVQKAAALAEANEEIEKKAQRSEASRLKAETTHKRTLTRLDREIAEKDAQAAQAAKEKLQGIDAELKGKLARNKEKKQKLKEDDYESYVVSGGEDTEKEENASLDRILEAFEEAGDDEKGTNKLQKFLDFMLKTSDMVLTKERVENNPEVNKYLKSNFKDQELGFKYEDFLHALPTEEDYKENGLGRHVEESERPNKTKKIPSRLPDLQQFGVPKGEPNAKEQAEELKGKLRKNARAKAKEPSQDVMDDLAALKDLPPTEAEEGLAFIKQMKESGVGEVEVPLEVKEEITAPEVVKPPKNRLVEAARESAAKEVSPIPSEAREALKIAAKQKEAKSARENERFAPRPEDKEAAERKNKEVAENKQWHEDKLELLSKSLLQAWKEMGAKITKDNEEEFLIKKPPFRYIFSAKGRKVRELYAQYVKELK